MTPQKPVHLSRHAGLQMQERGVQESEVVAAIRWGDPEPARAGRTIYRSTFPYDRTWPGRNYRLKQVAPVVAAKQDRIIVVTVYAFYF